jgi:hypothetical protein
LELQVLDGAKDALHVEASTTVDAPLAADQGRLDAFLTPASAEAAGGAGLVKKRSAESAGSGSSREPLQPRANVQVAADAAGLVQKVGKRSRNQ